MVTKCGLLSPVILPSLHLLFDLTSLRPLPLLPLYTLFVLFTVSLQANISSYVTCLWFLFVDYLHCSLTVWLVCSQPAPFGGLSISHTQEYTLPPVRPPYASAVYLIISPFLLLFIRPTFLH